MKTWKSKKKHDKNGVWSSEVNLRDADPTRVKKVKKLLNLLEVEGFDEKVS